MNIFIRTDVFKVNSSTFEEGSNRLKYCDMTYSGPTNSSHNSNPPKHWNIPRKMLSERHSNS